MKYEDNYLDPQLLVTFDIAIKENYPEMTDEDALKLKTILHLQNNFRANTSWKQQYEFALAIANAYAVGKFKI